MREPWVIQGKKNVYSTAGTVQLFQACVLAGVGGKSPYSIKDHRGKRYQFLPFKNYFFKKLLSLLLKERDSTEQPQRPKCSNH